MKKNKELEVWQGEIVDDPEPISPPRAVQTTALDKSKKSMDRQTNWIDTLVLIGGGIFKFFTMISENKSSASNRGAGRGEPAAGRRKRKHGRRS